mmetsp:Transcript_19974/g.59741  ORF Transcript_19974/g.59741 Transcript_19974/m.59741 type:complete len:196 (-) Transcript_19974:1092-1679(-)
MDSHYPERLRTFWKMHIRKYYMSSIYLIAISLTCGLGALAVTIFSRIAVLGQNASAAVAFAVTLVLGLVLITVAFELVENTCWPKPRSGLGALGQDPCRDEDYQRRWDEFQFVRQFVRGRLADDTEEVVTDVKAERERRMDDPGHLHVPLFHMPSTRSSGDHDADIGSTPFAAHARSASASRPQKCRPSHATTEV